MYVHPQNHQQRERIIHWLLVVQFLKADYWNNHWKNYPWIIQIALILFPFSNKTIMKANYKRVYVDILFLLFNENRVIFCSHIFQSNKKWVTETQSKTLRVL